jgi:hypothetical protein
MSDEITTTGLNEVPWDGWHDLSQEAELFGMVGAFIQRGEKLAVVQVKEGEWQAGWRHRHGRFEDTWGARMMCPREALRDATRRFWNRIKGDERRVFSHPPPRVLLRAKDWEMGPLLLQAAAAAGGLSESTETND